MTLLKSALDCCLSIQTPLLRICKKGKVIDELHKLSQYITDISWTMRYLSGKSAAGVNVNEEYAEDFENLILWCKSSNLIVSICLTKLDEESEEYSLMDGIGVSVSYLYYLCEQFVERCKHGQHEIS